MKAQNLVPNPSFEDTVHCPTSINELYDCQLWMNPTNATPDYFNACSVGVHVPNNGYGIQSAHTGVAYTGIYTFNKPYAQYREYIQIGLSSPLLTNHKYFISFYLSLAEVSQYAVSSIGAYLSSTPIVSTNTVVLSYSPQIQNKSSNVLTDKNNWMFISDTLYADGGEQYMTIGNFKRDSLSDTLFLGNIGGSNLAYYYIDDISVIDNGPMDVDQYKKDVRVHIYPNPANEVLNIEVDLQNAELKIIDVLGNEVKNGKFNGKAQIDISDLKEGIYFANIITSEGIIIKKIIVQH